jgi:8-oxo-dGTP pyrophosphatase MutT (NUDIX family)
MRQAATVLLLREQQGELEVLMMRRGESLAFMGGMWVFPGGRLDPADQTPQALARIPAAAAGAGAASLHSRRGERLATAEALGLRVAACRETFEESGVLLAHDSRGAPCDPRTVARLQPRRGEVVEEPAAFVRMLEDEDLYLDVAPLVYWSHWITPSLEHKRFDTRFFAVAVPSEQAASADLSELTEHAWVRPATVEDALARGAIRMVPPTLLTLEDLAESHARHGGIDAMLAAERNRDTPAVLPKIEAREAEYRVVMPWDPGYEQVAGESCEFVQEFPPHLTRRRSSIAVSRERGTGRKD